MNPPYDPTGHPIVEGDHSQLWLRQRRLRVREGVAAGDDETCACRRDNRTSEGEPSATIDSADLLQGRREVRITHGGETYRLLVTRNNKLILQK